MQPFKQTKVPDEPAPLMGIVASVGRLALVVLLASAIITPLGGAAARRDGAGDATKTVPTLAGEEIHLSGSSQVQVACTGGTDGFRIDFTASGPTTGPYPGLYSENGFHAGPGSDVIETTFTIVSGDTIITGTKWFSPPSPASTTACGGDVGPGTTAVLAYEAKIQSPSGVFYDSGTSETQFLSFRPSDPSVLVPVFNASFVSAESPAPLVVRGSGTVAQLWTTAVSSFTVDVTGVSAPKCGDATPATGSMELKQMRVTFKWGQIALLSASMTSPGYVYAGPGPSAVIAGNGSYTITTLRGTVLERGIGYIKVGIDAGTTGSVSGYVDPVGPQGPVEFPAAGQSSTFTGNVAILNHSCATPGPGPTPGTCPHSSPHTGRHPACRPSSSLAPRWQLGVR